ncbi:NYN domain-containing protein [Phytomonospora endophytica]|uniref:Putative RNA-binding protein with PIN domain n=1 Tax=Phytomonospora endophytica TaxID=714109 RepID=A0A841FEW9_9ACTN|nr:NYN domain-containing protein [Phytomonospora endophytica]MBB6034816.1 putative RNA-binding protein with PIN domain [Phytomonospora endophytica]
MNTRPGNDPADADALRPGEALAAGVEDTAAEPELPEAAEDEGAEPELPEATRQRIVHLTAQTLPALRRDELPMPLRKVAKFAPKQRARLGGSTIAAQLAADPAFRATIAAKVVEGTGELGAAVAAGHPPAAADPVEVAALAYLTRPEGWLDLLDAAGAAVRVKDADAAVSAQLAEAQQLVAHAEHDRAIAEREAEKLRVELSELRTEVVDLRASNRGLAKELRETSRREQKAADSLAAERGRLNKAGEDHKVEVRRLRQELEQARKALEQARHGARDARALNDARLWLLLETIGEAAQGLRRELALEPAEKTPADLIGGTIADLPGPSGTAAARGLDADDPSRLDDLLALPKAHLVVDGYNVTMRGYKELSLEQQRARLIRGMSGLAAQTGAETTIVFDGAERMHGLPPAPRGVRVLFSRKGETADEVIRALVRAEPNGRPVIVISSDKEVADGTRRHGAYPLSSDTLLRRLSRA